MSGLVVSTGTARLAAIIAGHVGGQVSSQRPQLELGRVLDLGGGALAVQPDSWTSTPFESFLRLEPLDLGLLSTEPAEAGDHGEHTHALHDPFQPLQANDRVLLCWAGASLVVMGRVA